LIPFSATNMVFEPFTQRIYAAQSSSFSINPNSVFPIDPYTGQVGAPILVGNGPKAMAVSDDGQFLYSGLDTDHTLGRLNLYTNKPETAATLGTDPVVGATLRARNIQPVPGDPHTAAVSVIQLNNTEAGVDLVHDGVLSSRLGNNPPDNVSVDSIAFASDPTTFFGSEGSGYFTFTIGTTGLTASRQQLSITGNPLGDFVSDATRFFTTSGRILDPATAAITGNFVNFSAFANPATAVVPNTDIGRVFFLNSSGTVAAFDSGSLQKTGQVGFQQSDIGTQLLRWGSDGFAVQFLQPSNVFHENDRIVIFRGSLGHVTQGL